MNFTYLDDYDKYQDILNIYLKDCLCKHILNINTNKSKELLKECNKINYNGVIWGYCNSFHKDSEINTLIQISIIRNMISKNIKNSIRIIIDPFNNIWVDNLHTAIKEIIINDINIKLKDISIYIIDFKNIDNPIIVDINNSLDNDLNNIKGAIDCGYKRLSRCNQLIGNINYTINDFLNENDFINLYKNSFN